MSYTPEYSAEKHYYIFNTKVFPISRDRGDIDAELYGAGYMTSPKDFEDLEVSRRGTMAYQILAAHNVADDDEHLQIKFDALTSHDITYVGIIQTARASGLERFPIPYIMTNCHNSLCAVGGTINEDDHRFGLSCAKKYGGIFVPPHMAVMHQYMREQAAGCGKMILGSDSHTRYGALGTMGVGEGGPELVKQLLGRTYDIARPDVVGVYLTGKPRPGVGPQDVALAIIGRVFKEGLVTNKVLEFIGDGIKNLSVEYRCGIDVMTTETTCLSSIWITDDKVRQYLKNHGREQDYRELKPGRVTLYDALITVDLGQVESMIALPFHPSRAYAIHDFNANAADLLHEVEQDAARQFPNVKLDLQSKLENGRLRADQGIVAGCAGGTFENLVAMASIMRNHSVGSAGFDVSAYPSSMPVFMELVRNGRAAELMAAGITVKTAFCGPCFGAGDTPANNAFSLRHTTRNFPNREGSKPGAGQLAAVALMDARSIAATAANGGFLTAATDLFWHEPKSDYHFDPSAYTAKVYASPCVPHPEEELVLGPNITDWPEQPALSENLLLQVASVITDPVTTTDELIPSGETSSYRSNPRRLSEFALSRRDPGYVGRAKATAALTTAEITAACALFGADGQQTNCGSVVCAVKPGDGSAREQAASCQRVLGGAANITNTYATKRYRSNLINWGMLPFTTEEDIGAFQTGDWVYIPGILSALQAGLRELPAYTIRGGRQVSLRLTLPELTAEERTILERGCLINHYRAQR